MKFRHGVYVLTIASTILVAPALSAEQYSSESNSGNSSATALEEVYVYGDQGSTNVATKLTLSVIETPQTITSISRAQLDDFALTKINEVLDYTPGVTVEEIETDRTYYTARGFDIVNFQYDGVGVPFISGINLGQQDTALFEKVEVVKGAAGLITGLANPSATINYVRKRPTEAFSSALGLTVGQWNGRRIDADVSGSLAPNVNGRAVLAFDQSDSYLDRHSDETALGYGVLGFKLSDHANLTLGHSHDKSDSDGVLWGALPLVYTDNTQTDLDVSTSTAPDWSFAENTQDQTFVEFAYKFNENWSLDAQITHSTGAYDSELFYVYGQLDPETGLGLNGWASAYQRDEKQTHAELFVTGDFDLWGQTHKLVVGYSDSDTELKEKSYSDPVNGFPVLGADWAEGNTPALDFSSHDPATQASDVDLSQKALYFASRMQLVDSVAVLFGARHTELEQSGISYGGESAAEADEVVPYVGLTWNALKSVMLYGSYSEVFKQQTWVAEDLSPLGPTLGASTEFGFKKSFYDERAILTVARFVSDQENFGVFVGRNDDGIAIYEGRELSSSGFEIELAGELTTGLNVGAGFTDVKIEDESGEQARPFIPEQLLKLSVTYRLPFLPKLRLGGLVKWQDTITTPSEAAEQEAYTLLDLAAHYRVSDNLDLSLNIGNVTDQKYLNSLYWEQGYYGAPRNVSASLRYAF